MQGRQNVNTERKGPHKSMHCKFCKPPGVTTPEKPTRAQMETKTKIHLVHEAADLRLCNIYNEPGVLSVESEACLCVLEGENDCPKCLPDKNRPPPKKKVCRCPKGAKPHPGMANKTTPKEKKPKVEDDEFWWEKYSREHDAMAKETWEAYMAQRRKDKKLEKCQRREEAALMASRTKGTPLWYQKLSCQQMIYVEFLSTAIRLDADENITDRTYFVLGGIGLYPRPSKNLLKRCLRYCHYNSIQFLNQLHMLTKDEDPFKEKQVPPKQKKDNKEIYTWNERLIMNSMCYLEFPALLNELMDRLPSLPRKPLLPQIPYPVFPKLPKKKYDSPYDEPIWQDRLNWVEKMKIDRLNRCRAHMNTKRMKIPPLALMRRPSLIDARPPFLAQIEANERASRRLIKEKVQKHSRKHPISTFNSAVDVTAIAGIEASEISTTDKADTDDICVFLREPKELESMAGEVEEEPDFSLEKEVRFMKEPARVEETEVNQIKVFTDFEENSIEGEAEDIPFKTPPKTGSGVTIKSPCPPPNTTPGPPATHYDKGKRELDIINENICGFCPFVSSSTQTVKNEISVVQDDVELKLKSAAAKLKKIADGVQNTEEGKKIRKKMKKKKSKKKGKCKKKNIQNKTKKPKPFAFEEPDLNKENIDSEKEERAEENDSLVAQEEEDEEEEEEEEYNDVEEEEEDDLRPSYKKKKEMQKESERQSELSDPDPDTDDEWSMRPPCTIESEEEKPKKILKRKRKSKKPKRKLRKQKGAKQRKQKTKLKDGMTKDFKKTDPSINTVLGSKSGQGDSSKSAVVPEKEEQKEIEREKSDVFRGDVEPLVQHIISDLAEEGFYSASYPLLYKHPEVDQLILHLKGEIVDKKLREKLRLITKGRWELMKGPPKFPIPDLGISPTMITKADWNDKIWISRLAKSKIDQFYYKVANSRAMYGKELYDSMYQSHFGTDRYLKIFYAYMISKYEDAILKGIQT